MQSDRSGGKRHAHKRAPQIVHKTLRRHAFGSASTRAANCRSSLTDSTPCAMAIASAWLGKRRLKPTTQGSTSSTAAPHLRLHLRPQRRRPRQAPPPHGRPSGSWTAPGRPPTRKPTASAPTPLGMGGTSSACGKSTPTAAQQPRLRWKRPFACKRPTL